MDNILATDSRSFVVEVDPTIYSALVCQKACYALMAYISCSVKDVGDKLVIEANISPECDKSIRELNDLLLDELMDYSLREKISEKTESIRNLILSNAFSNTSLIE